MTLRQLLLVGVGLALVAVAPRVRQSSPRTPKSCSPAAAPERRDWGPAALSARVSDLQAAQRREASGVNPSAGDLWLEVNRLKRQGQNVRQIEWLVSDLEGSLRRGSADATTRRHILNQLSYETQALRRRSR